MSLVEKIVTLHASLDAAEVPHAFGGALALAWCTQQARGTIDIDVNAFVDPGDAAQVFRALPPGVIVTDANRTEINTEGQSRLWWDSTPVDIFFNTTDFHRSLAQRARLEEFAGVIVPFLSCPDLAVFKAFFNRTKDWADLEAMAAAETLDYDAVLEVLAAYLGRDDDRLDRLRSLMP